MGIVTKDGRLNRYAANLIRRKASSLIGRYGLTQSDREDIEQDLWTDLIGRQNGFDPERGAETTFIAKVVNNRVASLIEHEKAKKRDYRVGVDSLDDEIKYADNKGLLRHEVVTKNTYLRKTWDLAGIEAERQDRLLDVKRAMQALSPRLWDLALLLGEMSISEAARVTGIPRTTINEMRKTIRRVFEEEGVDDWVK